ncbi:MAG TPA: ATP-binding protein [Polyangia bacterium]|nr:ATP-binding protein [Polyangia bacterium]
MRATGRWLFAAFAATILCFFGSTLYVQSTQAAIDRDALSIAHNASPSIQHLSSARAELRHLEVLLETYLDDVDAGRPGDRASLQSTRAQIDAEVRAYLRLPTYPGEHELWLQVQHELAAVDAALEHTFAAVDRGQLAAARADARVLHAAADRAYTAARGTIEVNARRAGDIALRIERHRQHSTHIAYGLDLLSAVLAVTAALLARRALKHHTSVLEAHSRLLAERAEEREQFAGRVAHDILSPLNAVSFALDYAQRTTRDDARTQDMLERGLRSMERIKIIVEGLLEFARAGGQPEPGARAEVPEVMADLLPSLSAEAAEKQAELQFEPCAPCAVACSAGLLTSLIANLVRNAIKYCATSPVRHITVRALAHDTSVRIEVEDTGPGLPPGFERTVFEPYVRAPGSKQPGIGLGLATVKRVAVAHGGAVGVQSVSGRGCRFWFDLPALPPRSPAQAPRAQATN